MTRSTEREIKELRPERYEQAVSTLVEAFMDDPVAEYFFPKESQRRSGMRVFFMVQLKKLYGPAGQSYASADYSGVAIWSPSTRRVSLVIELIALSHLIPILKLRSINAINALSYIERSGEKFKRTEHFYLASIGVHPEKQGRGIGSALIRHTTKFLDNEGLGSYLESSKEINVPLYERHGYRVVDEICLPKGGPKLYLMWRDPSVCEF